MLVSCYLERSCDDGRGIENTTTHNRMYIKAPDSRLIIFTYNNRTFSVEQSYHNIFDAFARRGEVALGCQLKICYIIAKLLWFNVMVFGICFLDL